MWCGIEHMIGIERHLPIDICCQLSVTSEGSLEKIKGNVETNKRVKETGTIAGRRRVILNKEDAHQGKEKFAGLIRRRGHIHNMDLVYCPWQNSTACWQLRSLRRLTTDGLRLDDPKSYRTYDNKSKSFLGTSLDDRIIAAENHKQNTILVSPDKGIPRPDWRGSPSGVARSSIIKHQLVPFSS